MSNMNQNASTNTADAIYQEALEKLEAIAKRHKEEIDAYLDELNKAQIKDLENELQA